MSDNNFFTTLDPMRDGKLAFTYGRIVDLCKQQAEFMQACEQPIGAPTDETTTLWDRLIGEEIDEAENELTRSWNEGESNHDNDHVLLDESNLPQYVAELADALYVIFGQINNLGVQQEFQNLFNAIHEANMKKVDPDTGKVIKREDGKVLKPKGWKPVNVEEVFYNT